MREVIGNVFSVHDKFQSYFMNGESFRAMSRVYFIKKNHHIASSKYDEDEAKYYSGRECEREPNYEAKYYLIEIISN